MNVNWKVRLKNKAWWLAIVPAVLVLAQAVLAVFGVTWDYSDWAGKIAAIIEALFMVLALMGIVTDPTVDGFSDSERALGYDEPAPSASEIEKVKDIKTGGTD